MSGSVIPPTLFFLKIAKAIQNLLWFHINFWIICSSCIKRTLGIWIEIVLNLYIALGHVGILMMSTLLVHEHSMYFHLFVPSSISFFSILQFPDTFSVLPEGNKELSAF